MRVIAGSKKGKVLKSPTTEKTRPTLDRVKEAVFSMLTNDIENARILDLFSGTGNLAIEALSRGAEFAHINDIDKEALKVIYDNIRLTQFESYVKITRKEYEKCLKGSYTENEQDKFDIIFLDPPFNKKYEQDVLENIVKYKVLKENGVIVLETDKRKEFNEAIDGLVLKDKRTYGRVMIRVYIWEA